MKLTGIARVAVGLIAAVGVLLLVQTGLGGPAQATRPTSMQTPTAVVVGSTVYLFATSSSGAIYFTRGDGGGSMSTWQRLPGVNAGRTIAAVTGSDSKIHLFVLGTDGKIYQSVQTGPVSFAGFGAINSGILATEPVATLRPDGRITVVAASSADNIFAATQSSPNGGFLAFTNLGHVDIAPSYGRDLDVSVTSHGYMVVTAGYKYNMLFIWDGSGWRGWKNIRTGTNNREFVDHNTLIKTTNSLFSVGLNYWCDSNCDIRISEFNDVSLSFLWQYFPGDTKGQARFGPPAGAARAATPQVFVVGTDLNTWFQPHADAAFRVESHAWMNAGRVGSAAPNGVAVANAGGYTFLYQATSSGPIYYRVYYPATDTFVTGWDLVGN
jgi:hypothetical protein